MNIFKNKIFKDISISYIESIVIISVVAIFLPLLVNAFTKNPITFKPYKLFLTNVPVALFICAIVLGALAIQYMRLMMLSGITRMDAFKRILALNLAGALPAYIVYIFALLLPFHNIPKGQMLLFITAGMVSGLGFGFFSSSLTTVCNVFGSIISIALSAIFIFIVPSAIIKSNTNILAITMIIIACLLLLISSFIYRTKYSRIKSTTIN